MVKKKKLNQIIITKYFFLILKYRAFKRTFYRLESFFFNRNGFFFSFLTETKKIRHRLMANLYFLVIFIFNKKN